MFYEIVCQSATWHFYNTIYLSILQVVFPISLMGGYVVVRPPVLASGFFPYSHINALLCKALATFRDPSRRGHGSTIHTTTLLPKGFIACLRRICFYVGWRVTVTFRDACRRHFPAGLGCSASLLVGSSAPLRYAVLSRFHSG